MSHRYGVSETACQRHFFLRFSWILTLVFVVGACTQHALTPRLPTYIEVDAGSAIHGTELKSQSPIEVGLYIISDSSAPGSAPAIPDSMLSILGNRLRQFVSQNLALSVAPLTEGRALSKDQRSMGLFKEAQAKGLPFFLVAIFSSVENEAATHLGAQPIMAQLPGVLVENIALAELALVHTESRSIVFQSEGRSIANMDELTVPFGESNESGFM
ncbi:MAG: hypothetical protein VST68_12555, partial [Nitrospirota bacterium]|nr:hypothetical protein [Nitrospirota bacterium]